METARPQAGDHQQDHQQHIDELLQRYLSLLDEYTALRSRLSSLQTAMFQQLARANFAAERGMRYGQDYYDERMRASRRLRARVKAGTGSETDGEVPAWEVVNVRDEEDDGDSGGKEKRSTTATVDADATTTKAAENNKDRSESAETKKQQESASTADEDLDQLAAGQAPGPKKKKSNDPLRWYGLLAPMPLRLAQTQAIQAVEEVVPRLVSVAAEMESIEVEVRRARKRRAKVLAAKEKAAVENQAASRQVALTTAEDG